MQMKTFKHIFEYGTVTDTVIKSVLVTFVQEKHKCEHSNSRLFSNIFFLLGVVMLNSLWILYVQIR